MPVAMVHDTELRQWTQVVWACSPQRDGRHLCHETRVFALDLPHHQTLLLGTKRMSSEGCARARWGWSCLCSRWDKATRSFTYAWRAEGGHPITHRSCPIRRSWPSRGVTEGWRCTHPDQYCKQKFSFSGALYLMLALVVLIFLLHRASTSLLVSLTPPLNPMIPFTVAKISSLFRFWVKQPKQPLFRQTCFANASLHT